MVIVTKLLMNTRAKYLLSPWFIGALLLLICNDLWWKAAYSNALTGKLSDLSGVLVLGLLFNFISERNRSLNALFVIVFFTFWKSPLSEGLIVTWNSIGPFPIDRVVDYSDLLAFAVLPIVSHLPFPERKVQHVPLTALLACTTFALVSTSRVRPITGWEYHGTERVLSFRFKGSQDALYGQIEKSLQLYTLSSDSLIFEGQRVPATHLIYKGSEESCLIDSAEIIVLKHNSSTLQIHVLRAYQHPGQNLLKIHTLQNFVHPYAARKIKVWDASVVR